jgi:hypothetical protein
MTRKSLLAIVMCLAWGCESDASTDQVTQSDAAVERRCGPPLSVRQAVIAHPVLDKVRHTGEVLAHSGFSAEALEVARTIGASNLLARIPAAEAEATKHRDGSALHLLQIRQALSDRIQLTLLDVARTAAEADCEEERADQLADRLQETRDTHVRRLTLWRLSAMRSSASWRVSSR